MPHLIIRLIARQADVDSIIDALCSVENVERVRLIDDLVPQMGEETPVTTARPADIHPTLCSIDIDINDPTQTAAVRKAADAAAHERGITPEFIEDD